MVNFRENFSGNADETCQTIANEYERYLFDLMARSRGTGSETPMNLLKELGVFLYKDQTGWSKTSEATGDSYSVPIERVERIEAEIPPGATEQYFLHTHPSEVNGLSVNDVAAFIESIHVDNGIFVLEPGEDNIVMTGIIKTDPEAHPTESLAKGTHHSINRVAEAELERVENGVLPSHEAISNLLSAIEPYTETCVVNIPR